MSRALTFVLGFACAASTLPAQAPGASGTWLTGTWQLDSTRSDPIARNPRALGFCGSGMLVPRDRVIRGAQSTGPSGAALVPRGDLPPGSVIQGKGSLDGWSESSDPAPTSRLAFLLEDVRASRRMEIVAGPSSVSIVAEGRSERVWRPDGQHHVEAQLEGGVLDRIARWKGETLVVELADPACPAKVIREFRKLAGGDTLQLRIGMNKASAGHDRNYYYTRATTGAD